MSKTVHATRDESEFWMSGEMRMTDPKTGRLNAYGTVLHQDDNGKTYPIICGHGGSMWLCPECADALLKEKKDAST